MPAPMMMASKSGIGVTPLAVFGRKTTRTRATRQTPLRRVAGLQVCRRSVPVGFTQGGICPYRQNRIALQAAAGQEEGNDGPGRAAQADVDRRQRPPFVSGRHLAAPFRATAPRRSRALLRGLAVWTVLVG